MNTTMSNPTLPIAGIAPLRAAGVEGAAGAHRLTAATEASEAMSPPVPQFDAQACALFESLMQLPLMNPGASMAWLPRDGDGEA